MQQNSLVKLNVFYTRIVNADMKEWIGKNKNRTFRVERVVDNSVKLYRVDFWITDDLLLDFHTEK